MRKLEIFTFGNAARQFRNPPLSDLVGERQNPGERVIRYIEHYANSDDFVARIGVLQFTTVTAKYSGDTTFSGEVFTREGTGHLLNQHYLDTMFKEDNNFMNMMVPVTRP